MACFGANTPNVPEGYRLIAVPYNSDGEPCGNCFYLLSPKEWEAFSKNPEIILSKKPLNQSPLKITDIFNHLKDLNEQEDDFPGTTPEYLNLEKLNILLKISYYMALQPVLSAFIISLLDKNLDFIEIPTLLNITIKSFNFLSVFFTNMYLFTYTDVNFKVTSKIIASILVSPYIMVACRKKGICIKNKKLLHAIPFVLQNTGNLHPSPFRCTGTLTRRKNSIKIFHEQIPLPNLY